MKILMLCPLMSSSSMITVYPMAKTLSKKHEVTLVGPLMGKQNFIEDRSLKTEITEPLISKPQQLAMLSLYPKNLAKLLRADYDVVHAFKLLPHTAPAASMAKHLRKKKFVLSIDDYDVKASSNPAKRMILKLSERSYKNADAVTVSSTHLQKIYGGEVLYQVPNENLFLKAEAGNIRKHYGLEGKTIIFYAGTFYEHKGLDILIKAVQKVDRKNVRLVLAGDGGISNQLKEIAGPETIFTGYLPMADVAKLTAASDIYAIPTKDTPYARAEIPGKIFEPMMLGKPIVASRISDIPDILGKGKCGLLPRPGDVEALAQSIEYLIENPSEAKKLGNAAKKRYFSEYDMKQFGKKLNQIYEKLEART